MGFPVAFDERENKIDFLIYYKTQPARGKATMQDDRESQNIHGVTARRGSIRTLDEQNTMAEEEGIENGNTSSVHLSSFSLFLQKMQNSMQRVGGTSLDNILARSPVAWW